MSFDLTSKLMKTERLNCPVLQRAHAGVRINELQAAAQIAREASRIADAELAKAVIIHVLEGV